MAFLIIFNGRLIANKCRIFYTITYVLPYTHIMTLRQMGNLYLINKPLATPMPLIDEEEKLRSYSAASWLLGNTCMWAIDVKTFRKIQKNVKNVKKRHKNKKRLKTFDKKRSSPIRNAWVQGFNLQATLHTGAQWHVNCAAGYRSSAHGLFWFQLVAI